MVRRGLTKAPWADPGHRSTCCESWMGVGMPPQLRWLLVADGARG